MSLGSTVDFLPDDINNVMSRINKANESIGGLKCMWDANEDSMMTKIKLHKAIPMHLSFHGSKNWSGNEADLKENRHAPPQAY